MTGGADCSVERRGDIRRQVRFCSKIMRLILDSLVALMLIGILSGVVLYTRSERRLEDKIELARAEVERFQSQIMLQAAMEKTELSQRGYPASIDAAWFAGNLPMNPLLGPSHPWVEIASEADRDLQHPRNRIAFGHTTAQYWYSPYTGVVRARVPGEVSDATALRLYNRINGSSLDDLYSRGD
jgi:type II secretory pathway pseudopilin PulG